MTYPKSLTSYLNRVSNVSRNTLKLTPTRTDAIKPNSIVVVEAPINAQTDMDTFVWHFLGSTSSTDACVFPRHIESLIEKISIELGNKTIGTCNNVNDLYNIMFNLNQGSDLQSKRRLYQKGSEQAVPTANEVAVPFKIQNWLGFIGSVQGRVLDLGVIGQLRIHITLADTKVLIKSAASTTEDYTLDQMYFTVDTISVQDGVYYEAKKAFLAGGGVIEMPFDNYYSSLFQCTSFNQANRFSVGSECVDYALACFPKNRTLSQLDAVTKQTAYFKYAAQGADPTVDSLVDWSFSVNNTQIPQYKAKKHDSFPLLLNVMGTSQSSDGGICSSIVSADAWCSSFWVAGVRFNLNTDVDDRTLSGLPTSNTNSMISFESSGVGSYNPSNLLLFVKVTSVLRVGACYATEIVL